MCLKKSCICLWNSWYKKRSSIRPQLLVANAHEPTRMKSIKHVTMTTILSLKRTLMNHIVLFSLLWYPCLLTNPCQQRYYKNRTRESSIGISSIFFFFIFEPNYTTLPTKINFKYFCKGGMCAYQQCLVLSLKPSRYCRIDWRCVRRALNKRWTVYHVYKGYGVLCSIFQKNLLK